MGKIRVLFSRWSIAMLATLLMLSVVALPQATQANGTPPINSGLSVYPHVPGLAQPPRYRFRVRELSSSEWQSPFAFFTFCKDGNKGYYSNALGGWSHTYCNFETGEVGWR